MEYRVPIEYGKFYHVYNRGVNGENLFRDDENYRYFFKLYAKHIEPIADTFAWSLLRNHFHFLVRIKESQEILASPTYKKLSSHPSKPFSNLFNAYAQAFNKRYQRTGTLFEKPFERRLVDSDLYFQTLVCYIHTNPVYHGFVPHFQEYTWTSYHTILSHAATKLQRDTVISWFSGKENFIYCHQRKQDFEEIAAYIIEH